MSSVPTRCFYPAPIKSRATINVITINVAFHARHVLSLSLPPSLPFSLLFPLFLYTPFDYHANRNSTAHRSVTDRRAQSHVRRRVPLSSTRCMQGPFSRVPRSWMSQSVSR